MDAICYGERDEMFKFKESVALLLLVVVTIVTAPTLAYGTNESSYQVGYW